MRSVRTGGDTGPVGTLGLLVVAVLLPTTLGYGLVGARRLRRAYDASRPPLPAVPSVERMRADLRRLHDLLDDTENAPTDHPAKYARCRAARAAYLDALRDACGHLGLAPPAGRPVPQGEIYRVETELRSRGFDVRPVS